MTSPYATNKLAWHPEALEKFRRAEMTAPILVQLMPTNVCNECCNFCCVAGTLIDTVNGPIPIEQIEVGDVVVSDTGEARTVQVGSRLVSDTVVIATHGGRRLRLTADHPVWASTWTEAGQLSVGDRIAAALSVRVRPRSEAASRVVESLRGESPAEGRNYPSGPGAPRQAHASTESDEGQDNSRASGHTEKGTTVTAVAGRTEGSLRSIETSDAVRSQPHEGPRDGAEGTSPVSRADEAEQERIGLHGVLPLARHRARIRWGRATLDRTAEPRLHRAGATESGGVDAGRGTVRPDQAVGARIRLADGGALRAVGMALPSGLPEAQAEGPGDAGDNPALLHHGGELVWDLGWDTVAAVLRVHQRVRVYNFSCQPGERYIANGLLVHNCSYGSGPESIRAKIPNPPKSQWKNQRDFRGRDVLPKEKMLETVACFQELGVKAVEVTGGGEPGTYPHFTALFEALAASHLEVALVSNGSLLDPERIAQLGSIPFAWVRISIDAGSVDEYVGIRHCPPWHWDKAWQAVTLLAQEKNHPEARVGVGYVVDTENWRGILDGCKRAKDAGADNVRLSMSFTPQGTGRWREHLDAIRALATQAVSELSDDTFQVIDLTAERTTNVVHGAQTYPLCAWKDVGCVVGPDQVAYACCSWAFSPMGRMGTIHDKTFTEMWRGEGAAWRAQHDPRRDCRIHCLYESRNMEALHLMGDPEYAARVADGPMPIHRDFI